ncbi:hypothetical protein D3Z36_05905 [Lachnospiraceae bacterium]|nr:hypothetical protein [Lachnospiraceae bacterium]
MFADNWKISLRQIRRLFIMDIFGMSSLILPGILSSMSGADGIFCLLLGMAGGILLLWLIGANVKHIKKDYYNYMKETAGQFLADIFMVFYFLYFVTLCGYVLYQITTLSLTWLLPDGSYLGVSLLLVLLGVYGSARGIEGRARVYEIIFWFLGIPLVIMLLLAMSDVNTAYYTPLVSSGLTPLLQGSAAVLIFLLPLTALLFLKPYCKKPEKMVSCGKTAMTAVILLNLAIYLVLLGVFGKNTMGVLNRPVITLMGMVNLPGGFFTRQDVLMTAVWFFALFALLNTGIFQGTLVLKELCQTPGNRIVLWVVAASAFAIGKAFFDHSFLMEAFEIYQTWVALPGMFLILLFLLFLRGARAGRTERKGGNG